MKKLLASLLLCFVAFVAHGLSDEDWAKHQPHAMYQNTDIMSKYKWPDINNFEDFFGSEQLNPTYTSWLYGDDYKKGTYGDNDEGGIVMLMAKKIWTHGVQICTMQIQAGNKDGEASIWIDFHYKSNFFKCMNFCEYGYGGSECATTDNPDCSNKDRNPAEYFSELSLLIDGGDDYRVTPDTDVYYFQYYNNGNNQRIADALILGVSELLNHGIKLLPLDIKAKRNKHYNRYTEIYSWINEIIAPKDQSAATTLLCLPGYKPNETQTDCVADTKYCNGTTDDTDDDDSTPTVTCGTSRKSGIVSPGICKQCAPGQIFSNTDQDCVTAKKLNRQEMTENSAHTENTKCWTIFDNGGYRECVRDGR